MKGWLGGYWLSHTRRLRLNTAGDGLDIVDEADVIVGTLAGQQYAKYSHVWDSIGVVSLGDKTNPFPIHSKSVVVSWAAHLGNTAANPTDGTVTIQLLINDAPWSTPEAYTLGTTEHAKYLTPGTFPVLDQGDLVSAWVEGIGATNAEDLTVSLVIAEVP